MALSSLMCKSFIHSLIGPCIIVSTELGTEEVPMDRTNTVLSELTG